MKNNLQKKLCLHVQQGFRYMLMIVMHRQNKSLHNNDLYFRYCMKQGQFQAVKIIIAYQAHSSFSGSPCTFFPVAHFIAPFNLNVYNLFVQKLFIDSNFL